MKSEPKESIYGTIRHFATKLQLTERRIYQLIDEGAPKDDRNKLNKENFYLWYISFRQAECEKKLNESVSELDRERTRKEKESADRMEMENAEKRGQLINVDDVKQELQDIVTRLSSKLDSLPNKLAAEILSCKNLTEAKEKAKDIVNNIKYELGGEQPRVNKKPVKKAVKRKIKK